MWTHPIAIPIPAKVEIAEPILNCLTVSTYRSQKPHSQLPHLTFIHRIFPTYTKDPISSVQCQKTALIKSITSKWHPKSSQIPSLHLMRIDHSLLRLIWRRRMIIRILSRYVFSQRCTLLSRLQLTYRDELP
jgi:hypothetical protein